VELNFGYGHGTQTVRVPDANLLDVLRPNPASSTLSEAQEVRRALDNPIDSPPLREIIQPGEKVVVVSSDITRPVPTARLMPFILDELYAGGVKPEDITLLFALGSHRAHSPAEREKLAGARAWAEIACVDSDPQDCQRLGVTARGTPVDITRRVATAERCICLGNVEYHYFAGYSGGAKALMPGVSSRAAIQANHAWMLDENARAGKLEGNPLREDIEEAIARFCPIDFILNVVLDEKKQVLRAVAGHPVSAHRAGCAFLDSIYKKEIGQQADIVLCSQGGAPKDLNLYQTQKALDNAKHAVKPGGVIILMGACPEGMGGGTFETWMTEGPTPQAMIERIRREFVLGGHKAAAIAMVLRQADIYLVSEMTPEFVRRIFLQPFSSAQAAFDAALEKIGPRASVLVMPYGGSTLPVLRTDKNQPT
jgi:nickel-dependent lactate racemase